MVFWQVDVVVPEMKEISRGFGVWGLPTYVLADAQGEVLAAILGFDEAEGWAAAIGREAADRRTFVAKQEAFAASPTVPLGLTVATTAEALGDFAQTVRVYRELEGLEPGTREHALPILSAMVAGFRNDAFTLEEVAAAADRAAWAGDGDPERHLEVASLMLYVAQRVGDFQAAVPYVARAVEATAETTDEELQQQRARLLPAHALYVEGDREKAVRLRHEMMPEGWQDEARALNSVAWWHLQHKVELETAERLARRGVELAATDKERANILDTLGEILAAAGRPAGAMEAIDRAIELDPENEQLAGKQQRFLELADPKVETGD